MFIGYSKGSFVVSQNRLLKTLEHLHDQELYLLEINHLHLTSDIDTSNGAKTPLACPSALDLVKLNYCIPMLTIQIMLNHMNV